MATPEFTTEVLMAAIQGFESQKRHIDGQIAELRRMLDGSQPQPTAGGPSVRKRRVLSVAARARIAAAQRKRWAEAKQNAAQPEPPARKRGKLSAAGRKAISEASKARWARARAEAEKPKAAAPKPGTPKTATSKPVRKIAKSAPAKQKTAGVAAAGQA